MQKTKVLFVCLGNICRSPMAEAIFNHIVAQKGLSEVYEADSAGTAAYHLGANPDYRTIQVLRKHGIETYHKGRQVSKTDFEKFDYIFAMDHDNLSHLKYLAGDKYFHKLQLIRTFEPGSPSDIVPDPYYGNLSDFEKVYFMLEKSILHWLAQQPLEKK